MRTDDRNLDGWIIWGGAGHAKVVREALAPIALPLVAVFDNAELRPPFEDVELHRGRDGFAAWRETHPGRHGFVVAIGGDRGSVRCELHAWLLAEGLLPITVTHRTAFVAASARLGAGTHVLANASVCVDVVVGEQCIINTRASVDHESRLGNGVHIAPGACLAGLVEVGDHAFIGIGANVLPRIKIGARAIVGAGAVVTRDVPSDTTVVGVPAAAIAQRNNG